MTITKLKSSNIEADNDTNLKCLIDYTRRSWFSKEAFKLEGAVYEVVDKNNKTPHVLISGNWNSKVYVQRANQEEGKRECIWTKAPYPEMASHMYGMSHFSLQVNYFPSWLHNKVAPTDTRRRPD